MPRPFDGDTRITLRETDGRGKGGRKSKKKTTTAALSELIAALWGPQGAAKAESNTLKYRVGHIAIIGLGFADLISLPSLTCETSTWL